ncbi:hypothetical protein DVK85_04530 [Flavobacterium arcticum]|uniref:Uncharacterized protein n=1 Tax=Flavobacterium arcticum TaxID=1784713 RepID=A0A345HAC5_9FLAO|nr:hypothetical protein [Flavobacterium arcticum]AXG73535.1 hypothetical protein DVK85_04530 [Flavobacterium arcticum]KAF2513325.1 hypothetical protein E0W72_02585 [Flavobacterium arcticum]
MPTNNTSIEPKSHFFTDPNLISQTESQAFGPQSSSSSYNISSKFTASTDAKAFAVCKGIVLIQPQVDNANKVNLILRPYAQPVQGVNIKYFIYRGLKKSDFFTDNMVKTGGSDFIQKIRTDFSDFYQNDPVNPNPNFLAKYIGFDPENQDENLLIDSFFFKESEYVESNGEFIEDDEGFGSFELPLIHEGAWLGDFAAGECAFDVVLNYGDYKSSGELSQFNFDLSYARATSAEITLNGATDYENKCIKEQIFQFIDAAAYYGFHTANGTVITDDNGTKQNNEGQGIYNNVLTNFITKNKLYLYIQGDRTRSYNFYNNYKIGETNNSLKYGIEPETLNEREYATDGWSVIIESPPNPTTYLQFVTDNNVNTVLYGQVADITNAAKNNFSNADDLLLPPNEEGEVSAFTKVLELSNPVSEVDELTIATFNIILYQGVVYDYIVANTLNENLDFLEILDKPTFLDDIFDLITAEPLLKNSVNDYSEISSYKLKLINKYYNSRQNGTFAVQTLVAKDKIEDINDSSILQKRVTYVTEIIYLFNDALNIMENISSYTKSSSSINGNVEPHKTYKVSKSYNIKEFTDDTEIINGIEINNESISKSSKIIIGITDYENQLIREQIVGFEFQNPRLFFVNLIEDENIDFISTEGISYKKYKIGIVGENATGDLQIKYPENDIIIYSLDGSCHFSKDYSINLTEEESILVKEYLNL